MKCANCGAELKVGCIYCSVCGKEAQIVSDYNLLEDDFLRNMLQEREEKSGGKLPASPPKKRLKKGDAPRTQMGRRGKQAGISAG